MTKFTSEIKLKIIRGFNSKIFSQKEYAKQMGVTRAQFQYWLKLYELHGDEGFRNTYTNNRSYQVLIRSLSSLNVKS